MRQEVARVCISGVDRFIGVVRASVDGRVVKDNDFVDGEDGESAGNATRHSDPLLGRG
jgi:hypothetical protein